MTITRRQFLQAGLAAGLCQHLNLGQAVASTPSPPRCLVLLQLNGGNDSLNTLVPAADPLYKKLRPRLAIEHNQLITLDDQTGLHPALEALLPAWQAQEMAWVQGLGYAQPNRSHFRSIEIWQTGSDANQTLQSGWLDRVLREDNRLRLAQAIALGKADPKPVDGPGIAALNMDDPERFLRMAKHKASPSHPGHPSSPSSTPNNPALAYLQQIQHQIDASRQELAASLPAEKTSAKFPNTAIGRDLHNALRLIASGKPPQVILVSHGSFDTHARQATTHQRLLKQLAEALTAFRQSLKQRDLWQHTLVASYSEFGRRARENASGGTDHGTAAAHFLLGGRVQGGLYGQHPSLARLDNNDLRHTTDYRRLYSELIDGWFQYPANHNPYYHHHRPLNILRRA